MRKIRTQKDEEAIFSAQFDEVERKYGEDAADHANYGWGSTDHDVATKVYTNPRMVLRSWLEGDKVRHEWSEYGGPL